MSRDRRPPGDPFGRWCVRWRLRPDGAPIRTSGCDLLPVRLGDKPAMLKIAHEAEERSGAGLMAAWGGCGAALVLEHEGEALLMERATGTRSLRVLSRAVREGDDEASRILCEAIAALHAPRIAPIPDLIPLESWFGALLDGHGRYGGITTHCADLARTLLASRREPVTLHGDIHHGNVLDFAERGWLAIDPKGLHGDRAFDYANLFRNGELATAEEPAAERFGRRLDVVRAASGIERHRLIAWTMSFAALSSVWIREDGGDAEDDLAVVELCAAELARIE